jgi:hypothetical protein
LGSKKKYQLLLDKIAIDHERISVSAGRRGLQMILSPEELQCASDATIEDLAKINCCSLIPPDLVEPLFVNVRPSRLEIGREKESANLCRSVGCLKPSLMIIHMTIWKKIKKQYGTA